MPRSSVAKSRVEPNSSPELTGSSGLEQNLSGLEHGCRIWGRQTWLFMLRVLTFWCGVCLGTKLNYINQSSKFVLRQIDLRLEASCFGGNGKWIENKNSGY